MTVLPMFLNELNF